MIPRMRITFRRLTEADFGMLGTWLEEPLVARWWNHETTPTAVARDFGPSTRGEGLTEDWLAILDGEPFGLLQRTPLVVPPDHVDPVAAIVPVPPDATSLDYLIADPALRGSGLGPRMITAMLELTWRDRPDVGCVLVAVAAGNRRSWRALEKAGLRRVAEGDLEPDNPIDPPLHYVYRIDRPCVVARTT